MMKWFFALEYPHWLMIAGAALVAIGFIGFAFSQNRNAPDDTEKASERPK
jgi:drug/metabolite transporter (DMT)-like permease